MTKMFDESENPAKKNVAEKMNPYPFYSPRFWHGMRFGHYVRLMWRNRFMVHPARSPMAALLFPITAFNSAMYRVQQVLYGRKIRDAELEQPPVFIVGHWRSGTTHLHELMCCDDRFTYPTTYECFAPYHFLVTGGFIPKMTKFLLPSKRPMDNMAASFDHPQEDEFALCAMGAPTPYVRMAFPNRPAPYMEFLDMVDCDPRELEEFRHAITWFVQALTVARGKQVMLKSPPHTGRVGMLADWFPGAKFIHIVRDPYALFPSTRRTWQALDAAQGFQLPKHRQLDEYIFTCLERMYGAFHSQVEKIDSSQICQVRYEELVDDPVTQLESIYDQLDLGDFESVRPMVTEHIEGKQGYRRNRHDLEPAIKDEISRRWGDYIERYGYGDG